MNLRSRRLETLLGAPLDELTARHVRAMVVNGVAEAVDLDLKKQTYGRSDSDKRELAKDVAALANTVGGVLVIGVDEDPQGRAAATPGTDITDDEKRRLQQTIAAWVAPMPVFDLLPIPDPGLGEGSGYLLIAVPRSPAAPHAVSKDGYLRYPKRSGTTTYYLSEPEVATAYRERLLGAGRQQDRLADITRGAIGRLERGTNPWVMVTLVPDLPGDVIVSRANLDAFRASTMEQPVTVVPTDSHFFNISVAQRCFVADNTTTSSPRAYSALLEMHTDGSGVYAHGLHDIAARSRNLSGGHDDGATAHMISDEWLVLTVLSGLHRLGVNARDHASAGGTTLLQVQLVPAEPARPVMLGTSRSNGYPELLHRSRSAELPLRSALLSATLDDLADPGPALVSAAAILTHDLGQAFGVTELQQVTRDGRIQLPYWSRSGPPQGIKTWAEQHDINLASTVG